MLLELPWPISLINCIYVYMNKKISRFLSCFQLIKMDKGKLLLDLESYKNGFFGKVLFPIHSSYIVGHGTSHM